MKDFNFGKVEIEKVVRKPKNRVMLWKSGNLVFPTIYTDELGWKAGDKVDLYEDGTTYAIKKDPNGQLTLRQQSNLKDKPLAIQNKRIIRHISSTTKNYRAKIYEDMIIFNY